MVVIVASVFAGPRIGEGDAMPLKRLEVGPPPLEADGGERKVAPREPPTGDGEGDATAAAAAAGVADCVAEKRPLRRACAPVAEATLGDANCAAVALTPTRSPPLASAAVGRRYAEPTPA